jgi:uncharacterized iron-regulated protein
MMRTLSILLVAAAATACASASKKADTTETPRFEPVSVAPGEVRILRGTDGSEIDFDLLAGEIGKRKVVYVGEQHNNDYQHAFQLRVVKRMYEQSPDLAIGMEMFQRPSQAALDAFVLGEIDEKEMLRRTEYFLRWGWDYLYYRPILLFARENGIPVIALNAPTEVRRKVGSSGLDSLTPGEREQIASEIDLTIEAHRTYLEKIWEMHPMGNRSFENFYAAQCVWEDTMAESIARSLEGRPNRRVVVIVGGGHVRQRYGIPLRAERRGAAPYAILLGTTPSEPIDKYVAEDFADYLFVTAPAPENAPTPKLGFTIDPNQAGKGIYVESVLKGSLAELAGLKAGDQILSANGQSIRDLTDVRIFLSLNRAPKGTVEILRDGERKQLLYDTRWLER